MGFALPLALLATIGIAFPLVAHLIRRRDVPRVVLPTIALLERAVAESRNRRRVEDPWLFASRVALLVLLACAFAAPFVHVALAEGDGRAAALAIVIDDSASMGASAARGSVFDAAKGLALGAIRRLPAGSEVTVIVASSPPRVIVDRLADPRRAVGFVESLRHRRHGGDSLHRAIDLAARRLSTATLAERRLLVFSDFAEHVDLHRLRLPSGLASEMVRVAPTSIENAAVSVRGVEADASQSDGLVLRADVRSNLRTPLELRVVGADGSVLASARIPAGTETRETRLAIGASRESHATARLEVDDALEDDDVAEFELRAPDETRVLFVDGDPHPSRRDDEVGFATRALELAPPSEARFRVTVVDEDRFDPASMSDVDVVVLANVANVASRTSEALTGFVKRGGGLFYALGDRVRGGALDASLRALLPARLGARVSSADVGVLVDRTSGRFDATGLSSTRVSAHHVLEPDVGATVVAHLDDGSAWIVAAERGAGHVVMLGSALDEDDSDLPLRAAFLPYVTRSIRGLATRATREERASAFPLAESRLSRGPIPTVTTQGRTYANAPRLRRDVSPYLFLALFPLLAAEGFARARRGRRSRRAQSA